MEVGSVVVLLICFVFAFCKTVKVKQIMFCGAKLGDSIGYEVGDSGI